MDLERELEEASGAGPEQNPNQVAALQAALKEATRLKALAVQLEEDRKATNIALQEVTIKTIPRMMDDLGMSEVVVEGWKVKLTDMASGGLPKEDPARRIAVNYLEEIGNADLLKHTITFEFGRHAHNEAMAVIGALAEMGYPAQIETTVHQATLGAFAKDYAKEHPDFTPEKLGVSLFKQAKITPVKIK